MYGAYRIHKALASWICMLFSLLRGCTRIGITVLGGACGVLAMSRGVLKEHMKSSLKEMGFVCREEFDALNECFRRFQASKEKQSHQRDKE
ncbi:hypothetical protein APHNP_1336 [Anaplasma phagocytophilum str. ApNP]|nr:hypothetical protein P029_00935 [Anaplasma phagocytophilum str. Norway variant2]KJV66562.1 hypothetical protein APHNP_1336 [Anaplasma phagocytophilum str. ApNP]